MGVDVTNEYPLVAGEKRPVEVFLPVVVGQKQHCARALKPLVAVPVVSRSPKPVSCTGRRSEPVSSSPVLVVASEPRGVPSSGPARLHLQATSAWPLALYQPVRCGVRTGVPVPCPVVSVTRDS